MALAVESKLALPGASLPGFAWESVEAFAGTQSTNSYVAYPASLDECIQLIKIAQQRGLSICPRGNGYTYADMILNHGQTILNFSKMNRVLSWSEESGQIIVEPGVMFSDIFNLSLLANWTLSSCPGGQSVTIGGAVANNVHGKDSRQLGNFGNQVIQFKLLLASQEVITVSQNSHPDIFKSVIGGMGLLGILVEITLQLKKVPSPFVRAFTVPVRNIEECIETVETQGSQSDFCVAWIDAFGRGRQVGRGFVTYASWAEGDKSVGSVALAHSLASTTRIFGILPSKPTWTAFRPFFGPRFIQTANTLNFHRSRMMGKKESLSLFTDYNFMHKKIPDLNHVYQPQGFLEFQPLLPRALGAKGIKDLLNLCHEHGAQSLLCGLKAHGADDFALSYSGNGYSLGVDIQLRSRRRENVTRFAQCLYDYTHSVGGKIYLAKDELMGANHFKSMYPKFKEFSVLKSKLDPGSLFSSDMYRRLF